MKLIRRTPGLVWLSLSVAVVLLLALASRTSAQSPATSASAASATMPDATEPELWKATGPIEGRIVLVPTPDGARAARIMRRRRLERDVSRRAPRFHQENFDE